MDISNLTKEKIIEICGRMPDVIWASPDCTTYSVMAMSIHRRKLGTMFVPKSSYANFCDKANINLRNILADYDGIYFIENPRGIMRKMKFWKCNRYTVTYCQYGLDRQKPTDIWTNHPDPKFKPDCKPGSNCHIASPRGTSNGSQGKDTIELSKIPAELSDHIATICDDYFKSKEVKE